MATTRAVASLKFTTADSASVATESCRPDADFQRTAAVKFRTTTPCSSAVVLTWSSGTNGLVETLNVAAPVCSIPRARAAATEQLSTWKRR